MGTPQVDGWIFNYLPKFIHKVSSFDGREVYSDRLDFDVLEDDNDDWCYLKVNEKSDLYREDLVHPQDESAVVEDDIPTYYPGRWLRSLTASEPAVPFSKLLRRRSTPRDSSMIHQPASYTHGSIHLDDLDRFPPENKPEILQVIPVFSPLTLNALVIRRLKYRLSPVSKHLKSKVGWMDKYLEFGALKSKNIAPIARYITARSSPAQYSADIPMQDLEDPQQFLEYDDEDAALETCRYIVDEAELALDSNLETNSLIQTSAIEELNSEKSAVDRSLNLEIIEAMNTPIDPTRLLLSSTQRLHDELAFRIPSALARLSKMKSKKRPLLLTDKSLDVSEFNLIFNLLLEELRWAMLFMLFIAVVFLLSLKGVQGFLRWHWKIFHEWPDGHQRFSLYNWPYNVPIAVVVLWGMCWKFATGEMQASGEDLSWLENIDFRDPFWSVAGATEEGYNVSHPGLSTPPGAFPIQHNPSDLEIFPPEDTPEGYIGSSQNNDVDIGVAHAITRSTAPYPSPRPKSAALPISSLVADRDELPIQQPTPQNQNAAPLESYQQEVSVSSGAAPSLPNNGNGDDKAHKCPRCPLSFNNKRALSTHVFSHDQERPVPCTFCEARFTRHDNMHKHAEEKHREQWAASEAGKLLQQKREKRENRKRHAKGKAVERHAELSSTIPDSSRPVAVPPPTNLTRVSSSEPISAQPQNSPSVTVFSSERVTLSPPLGATEQRLQEALEKVERLENEKADMKRRHEVEILELRQEVSDLRQEVSDQREFNSTLLRRLDKQNEDRRAELSKLPKYGYQDSDGSRSKRRRT